MPSIPITSALSYLGVFSLITGGFLILAGFRIIKIEKVTIASGRNTWIAGIVLVVIGIIALFPDITSSSQTYLPTLTPTLNTISTSTTISNTLSPSSSTATAVSIFQMESTQTAILRYKVVSDTSIYEQPNTTARIIENVSAGQVVESLKQDGDWVFVTYTVGNVRTTGWIQRTNLEIIK